MQTNKKEEIMCRRKRSGTSRGHSRAGAPEEGERNKKAAASGSQASALRTARPPVTGLPVGRGSWLRLAVSIDGVTSFSFFPKKALSLSLARPPSLPPSPSFFLFFFFFCISPSPPPSVPLRFKGKVCVCARTVPPSSRTPVACRPLSPPVASRSADR